MGSGEDPIWIEAEESWSVPVHAGKRTICLRPIVLEAPDIDAPKNSADGAEDLSTRAQVVYSCQWSDPLSRFSSFLATGLKLAKILRSDKGSTKYEGVPVLKEGEGERKCDPTLRRATIRLRICTPKSMNADFCEAQDIILYFCFTEN